MNGTRDPRKQGLLTEAREVDHAGERMDDSRRSAGYDAIMWQGRVSQEACGTTGSQVWLVRHLEIKRNLANPELDN